MSMLDTVLQPTNALKAGKNRGKLAAGAIPKYDYRVSGYKETPEQKAAREMVREAFTLGDVTMKKPRAEFNDLSVLDRKETDAMAFNAYQPNDGDPATPNSMTSWKSRAMRPITRNKCISVTAHATARTLWPKLFAVDGQNQMQEDAAEVMSSLMEWSGSGVTDETDYIQTSLLADIQAVSSPASILFHEYAEIFRTVKTARDPKTKKWQTDQILDEDLSGFMSHIVPVDQLYIENIYEPDIQKQGWLILRRVIAYNTAAEKYAHFDNFKYVKPGIQLVYDDPNQLFYEVYDQNMRSHDVEEVIYWHKGMDLRLIVVNNCLLSEPDAPNPREDKLYPFEKYGYEIINPRFFYYKSLAAKVMQDEKILNSLYQLVIDGTYMSIMPPLINVGGEVISSDVFIPGAVTTLQRPDSKVTAIMPQTNLAQGLAMLKTVEESIDDSTESPVAPNSTSPNQSTYQIEVQEQKAATLLGLFIKMRRSHIKQYGRLRIGDILQYLTAGRVGEIEGELAYKSFFVPSMSGSGNHRKIVFDHTIPDEMTDDEYMAHSYAVLDEQGGHDSNVSLYKVNPSVFRNLKYLSNLSDDVMSPRSEFVERALNIEEYDRLINNPMADQEEALKLLLSSYPATRRKPDDYISKNAGQPVQTPPNGDPLPPTVPLPPKAAPANFSPTPPQASAQKGI